MKPPSPCYQNQTRISHKKRKLQTNITDEHRHKKNSISTHDKSSRKWARGNLSQHNKDHIWQVSVILSGENLKAFPIRSGIRQRCPLSPLTFNIILHYITFFCEFAMQITVFLSLWPPGTRKTQDMNVQDLEDYSIRHNLWKALVDVHFWKAFGM